MRYNVSGRYTNANSVYAYYTRIGHETQIGIGNPNLHRMSWIDWWAVYILAGRNHDHLGVVSEYNINNHYNLYLDHT